MALVWLELRGGHKLLLLRFLSRLRWSRFEGPVGACMEPAAVLPVAADLHATSSRISTRPGWGCVESADVLQVVAGP